MSFATATIHGQGNNLHVSHGDDRGLLVEFEKVAIHQPFESQKEGRPIYKEQDFIRIIYPGDKTKLTYRPVNAESTENTPSDPERFKAQWDKFKAQETQSIQGTPITEWPPLGRAEVAELKGLNIHTVEALASLPDTALTWMGARTLRDKAAAWLQNAQGGAIVTSLQSENQSLRDDLELLKKQIADMAKTKGKKDDDTSK